MNEIDFRYRGPSAAAAACTVLEITSRRKNEGEGGAEKKEGMDAHAAHFSRAFRSCSEMFSMAYKSARSFEMFAMERFEGVSRFSKIEIFRRRAVGS